MLGNSILLEALPNHKKIAPHTTFGEVFIWPTLDYRNAVDLSSNLSRLFSESKPHTRKMNAGRNKYVSSADC